MDRLDHLVLAGSAPRAPGTATTPKASTQVELAGVSARPVVHPLEYISSKRGPRFVDYAPCPMCGHQRIGVEYQGELMSGAKVHTLFSHSMGAALVRRGVPRCLGAGLRVVFEAGAWKGLP